jgi:hypothetical protein
VFTARYRLGLYIQFRLISSWRESRCHCYSVQCQMMRWRTEKVLAGQVLTLAFVWKNSQSEYPCTSWYIRGERLVTSAACRRGHWKLQNTCSPWRMLPLGLWSRAIWQKFTDVSVQRPPSTFTPRTANQKCKHHWSPSEICSCWDGQGFVCHFVEHKIRCLLAVKRLCHCNCRIPLCCTGNVLTVNCTVWTSILLYFIACCPVTRLDTSESRSRIPGKLWNIVVLGKDGNQLDRSCEQLRSVTKSQEGQEYVTNNKKKEG